MSPHAVTLVLMVALVMAGYLLGWLSADVPRGGASALRRRACGLMLGGLVLAADPPATGTVSERDGRLVLSVRLGGDLPASVDYELIVPDEATARRLAAAARDGRPVAVAGTVVHDHHARRDYLIVAFK